MDENQFVAPEGVYTMTEQNKPPQLHTNLASSQSIYPTRLSTVILRFPSAKGNQGLTSLLGGNKAKDSEREKRDKKSHEDSASSSGDQADDTSADAFESKDTPMTTSLFSPVGAPDLTSKKTTRRPKHNMRTTSSSYVTRLQTIEGLNKILSAKSGDVPFLFYNSAKSFFWTEPKAKEPLARITFSAHPTCHSINTPTSHLALDIIIGFNTGDLIWFDPLSSRYVRLNKGGRITSSPCTAVHWVPHSRSLFLVSHADGTIIVYDKDREDPPISNKDDKEGDTNGQNGTFTGTGTPDPRLESWEPLDEMIVTPGPVPTAEHAKGKPLFNPVSHWRVSKKPVTAFAFSPDVRHVAVVGDCLRVIDALSERLVASYSTYFGSLSCVTWSPDGRFILAGGQDDLLTIFAPFEQRVVARCQGHSSFVTDVAFDPLRCNGRTYRFASVGEDNRLILWDFSGGALHRPKLAGGSSHHHHYTSRLSLSSTISLVLRRGNNTNQTDGGIDGEGEGTGGNSPLSRHHPAPSRNDVAVLQPVLTKPVEGDLLSSVFYVSGSDSTGTGGGIWTVSKQGIMKYWVRPLPVRVQRRLAQEKEGGDGAEPGLGA